MKRVISYQYGLEMTDAFRIGSLEGFYTEGGMYLFAPHPGEPAAPRLQQQKWADWFREQGHPAVARPVIPRVSEVSGVVGRQQQDLFQLVEERETRDTALPPGAALAEFHRIGRSLVPGQPASFFSDRWAQWWEQRLGQLETWYHKVEKRTVHSEAEEWLLQTFPYYMGKSENALQWMQYVRETGFENEQGTVVHYCFTPSSWVVPFPGAVSNKLPADWMLDHPSRDIAEWIRNICEEDVSFSVIRRFLSDYESRTGLSSVGRKLIAGRLLFPYYYMEQMEKVLLFEETDQMDILLQRLYDMWGQEEYWMELMRYLKWLYPKDLQEMPGWITSGRSFSSAGRSAWHL
ncbi:hypothetical protein [Salibacterium sp. K-3]